jgi:hypothetical protein
MYMLWKRKKVGLSHCRYDGLVTVRVKAHLRRGHNDQSHQGHQCSETTLTGESRFHIGTPLGIELRSLMTGSKRVVHWTSETWCECNEIAALHTTNIDKLCEYWDICILKHHCLLIVLKDLNGDPPN